MLENVRIRRSEFFESLAGLWLYMKKKFTNGEEVKEYYLPQSEDKRYQEALYANIQPVQDAIQFIADSVARFQLSLYDEDDERVIAEGREIIDGSTTSQILNRNFNFLHNKFVANGYTNSYPVFIKQTITNLKVHNEFFYKIAFDRSNNIFRSIKVVPSNLLTHIPGEGNYYIKEFMLSPYSGNNLSQERYNLVMPNSNIYKKFEENGSPVKDTNIDYYLLHYYEPDPLNICWGGDYMSLNVETRLDFRGSSRLKYLTPLIQKYILFEDKSHKLLAESTPGRSIFRVQNTKEQTDILATQKEQKNTSRGSITQDDRKTVEDEYGRAYSVAKGGDISEHYKYVSHDLDFNKTIKPLEDIIKEIKLDIREALGIPRQLSSDKGQTYNNGQVLREDFEISNLAMLETIATFLTQSMRLISPEFRKSNYSIIVDSESSPALLKRKKQKIDILNSAGVATLNENRDVLELEQLPGGDEVQTDTPSNTPKELSPEEAVRQKRNTGKYGDRQLKKQ